MRCPFLKKMNVKYCGLRRSVMIPLRTKDQSMDLCSGSDYADCFLLKGHPDVARDQDHCPHLCVGDAHYCELDPAQKLIPCNQTSVSRCHDGGHKYCSLFLAASHAADHEAGVEAVDSLATHIPLPAELAYASNHMWYDHGDGGTCHVGVDAFFTSMVERFDSFEFVCHEEGRRPAVRFGVGGVDFDFVFPNPMQGTEINPHLMADPAVVLSDPYGQGWLFEGLALPPVAPAGNPPQEQGLRRDSDARLWMVEECDRLAGFVHDHLEEYDPETGRLIQDGGTPRHPVAGSFDRRTLVRLHADFFTTHPGKVRA